MTGEDKDMHGAHMVFTRGFFNVHVSHMELFDVGQPRLARYLGVEVPKALTK